MHLDLKKNSQESMKASTFVSTYIKVSYNVCIADIRCLFSLYSNTIV